MQESKTKFGSEKVTNSYKTLPKLTSHNTNSHPKKVYFTQKQNQGSEHYLSRTDLQYQRQSMVKSGVFFGGKPKSVHVEDP